MYAALSLPYKVGACLPTVAEPLDLSQRRGLAVGSPWLNNPNPLYTLPVASVCVRCAELHSHYMSIVAW